MTHAIQLLVELAAYLAIGGFLLWLFCGDS